MSVYWLQAGRDQLPDRLDWLSEPERAFLAKLRFAKRRDDWLLGRWTAKRALAAVLKVQEAGRASGSTAGTIPADRISILAAADGAPEVLVADRPLALSLSISHRDGVALCALSPFPCRLGCDLERIEPRSRAFVEDFFTLSEQAWLGNQPAEAVAWGANLIWSAKESALKLLRAGLRADTRSVQVEVGAADPEDRAAWRPLRVTVDVRRSVDGWWRRDGESLLLTVLTQPGSPPPVPLAEI